MNSSKNDHEVRRILRRTQENVDQSGESKAPLAWHVVKTKGVANQSWSKTFNSIRSTVTIDNISIVLELLLLNTCPSGQMNVKLKPTFGAGCKSKRYQIWCTVHSHPTIFNCPKQGSGWPEIFLGLRSKTNAVVLIWIVGLDFGTNDQRSVHLAQN